MKALSSREMDVLLCIAEGMQRTQIAVELGVSLNTVITHQRHMAMKLGARTLAHAVALAYHHRLLEPGTVGPDYSAQPSRYGGR